MLSVSGQLEDAQNICPFCSIESYFLFLICDAPYVIGMINIFDVIVE